MIIAAVFALGSGKKEKEYNAYIETAKKSEDNIEWGMPTLIFRYQMVDEEAEELIANGGVPSANTYVTTVNIDLGTGEVTEECGDAWTLELPGK